MLLPNNKFKVGPSNISGKGLFSTQDYKIGTDFGVAFIKKGDTGNLDQDIERTTLGKFTNHSANPNLMVIKSLGKYSFKALRDIGKDEELTVDYRTFDFEGKRNFC